MNKLTKFFMVCGVAFVVGAIMFAVGLGTGGVEGYQKVAEDHEWVSGSPGDRVVTETKDLEFDSIEAAGVMDVVIAGESYYDAAVSEYRLDTTPEPGMAVVLCGENLDAPTVASDGKTLRIEGTPSSNSGINLDFSEADAYPTVIVFCDSEELDSIKTSAEYSDVTLAGISFKSADIELNFGDIEAKNIISKGLNINNDMGDVELAGDLRGQTHISLENGDIQLDVKQKVEDYTIEASAGEGDIKIVKDEPAEYENKYTQDGGEDVLKVRTDYGDISISPLDDPDTVSL